MSHVPQSGTGVLSVDPEELVRRMSEDLERAISFAYFVTSARGKRAEFAAMQATLAKCLIQDQRPRAAIRVLRSIDRGSLPPEKAESLQKMGYRNVWSINGGWRALKDLLPTET